VNIRKQLQTYVMRAVRTSMTMGVRGVKNLLAIVEASMVGGANAGNLGRDRSAVIGGQALLSRHDQTGMLDGAASAERELRASIDLARFDDEEFEALVTGEWGVGWRMNEAAINRRQVLARSLREFLGSVEPEKTH
jgi:hypothetical protein